MSFPAIDQIGVIAQATPKGIVAGPTGKHVGGAIARHGVVEGIPHAIDSGDTRQREILQVGAKGPGDIAPDRVRALIHIFDDRIAGADDIRIVAGAPGEHIGRTVASQDVVERVASAIDPRVAQHGQIFKIGAQCPTYIALDGISALVGIFNDAVAELTT